MENERNKSKNKRDDVQKKRIRERYQGIDIDQLEIMPAIPQKPLFEENSEKRVAVYTRVSTNDFRQTSSYELQKNYYETYIDQHPGWRLAGIYDDEGISGTSVKNRDAFLRMIDDCVNGKIDLIITKSISRFARNIFDCIRYVRQLASLPQPVGVFFEAEKIYTLDSNSEWMLSLMASFAQEEAHIKSQIMNASIDMRFRKGIFLTPPLLGYDQDAEGNLVINEDEAETIRLIFFMYIYGYTCVQIAETLTKLERPTKKQNTVWSPGSVLNILQNERHCGDVTAPKTYTPNYLDHKSVKNNKQQKNKYTQRNHHEPIISRADFIAVQRLIRNARYGNRGFLPEIHVIENGVLSGFVIINPRWASFSASDYHQASLSVNQEKECTLTEEQVEAQAGNFDLRGYEVVRAQLFDNADKLCVTFSPNSIKFSIACIRKFMGKNYIEMLIDPINYLLAIRTCAETSKNKIRWAKLNNEGNYPCTVQCAAYIKTIYELFAWQTPYKYRVRGTYRQKGEESLIIFNMKETEIFIPEETLDLEHKEKNNIDAITEKLSFTKSPRKNVKAYPRSWKDSFGNTVYYHAQAQELRMFDKRGKWEVNEKGKAISDKEKLNVTNIEVVGTEIKQMILNMRKEVERDGE